MAKVYRVIASQIVFHEKFIEANSKEEAENLAFEYDENNQWEEIEYGDWTIEEVKLAKSYKPNLEEV